MLDHGGAGGDDAVALGAGVVDGVDVYRLRRLPVRRVEDEYDGALLHGGVGAVEGDVPVEAAGAGVGRRDQEGVAVRLLLLWRQRRGDRDVDLAVSARDAGRADRLSRELHAEGVERGN